MSRWYWIAGLKCGHTISGAGRNTVPDVDMAYVCPVDGETWAFCCSMITQSPPTCFTTAGLDWKVEEDELLVPRREAGSPAGLPASTSPESEER